MNPLTQIKNTQKATLLEARARRHDGSCFRKRER
jgi:hypothetical protein